jgi:thiol:disulfide interchange protein DsbA|tara:strand:+ start:244 stop:855 length:612 start_codon:yes stop_codon:yes gene_type:complete
MKKIFSCFIFTILISLYNQVYAFDGYVEITPAQPTHSGNKIEVLEVFWYGCPHCYDFEPFINKWLEKKPEDVVFRRMPGIFRKDWIPHAKAYFTAEKLNILNKIHSSLFTAIHKERKQIYDDSSIKKFFLKNDVDKKEFKKIYESDEVDTKIKQAYVMGQRYKITGVPAIIVNGKYMVSGSTAGSFENVTKIIDMLIEKERGG